MTSLITIKPAYYEQDSTKYDRVTEVIKTMWPQPELHEWRASMGKARANRDLRHAEYIGKEVDAAITALLADHPLKKSITSVEARQALRGFQEWRTLNPIKPVALQISLLDRKRHVGGTPDCLTLNEGFDWKTSARFNMTHLLQIDQYWRLADYQGLSLKRYRLVRFDKILGVWEELILEQTGLSWNGQWVTRETLGQIFDTLLTLYRQWQTIMGQDRSLPPLSNTTSTEAVYQIA